MSAKQESVSDAAFKTWLFSSHFNFASKDDRVTTATCKYCLLVVSPTVTNCCKELHLKYGKHSRSIFDNFTMHENQSGLCENQYFFLYFENVATFIKSYCVFLCYFLQYDEVFLVSLLNGCYHYLVFMIPVNGCSESKLLEMSKFH